MVFGSEADEESITGKPSQPESGQTVQQGGDRTHEPDSSLHTISQSKDPYLTVASSESRVIDIDSSTSRPRFDSRSQHLTPDSVEQEFIPLTDADADLYRVQRSDVESSFHKKNEESSSEVYASHPHVAEDNKVTDEPVSGDEIKMQRYEMEFDVGVEKEDDDSERDEKKGGGDGRSDETIVSTVDSNASVNDISSDRHLEDMKGVNAESKADIADNSSQTVQPASIVTELLDGNVHARAESSVVGNNHHSHPVAQRPAVSSGHPGLGQQSDADFRHLRHPRMDQLPRFHHFGEDFGQRQNELRGEYRQEKQPDNRRLSDEFDQHLHHNTYPSDIWKHIHSSPVEEFHNKWPEMQEAYMTRLELLQEQQRLMNHVTGDDNFLQRDWSHSSPQEDPYFQNHGPQHKQFIEQIPDLLIPGEDSVSQLHYGDTFNDRRDGYQHQHPNIRQPNIHVEQIPQQHLFGHRHISDFDVKELCSEPVDKHTSSAGSVEQPGFQAPFLTVDWTPRYSADKSDVDPAVQRVSPVRSAERDAAEDLTETTQTNSASYLGADFLSSSEKYTGDVNSQTSSPLIDRRSDHISGR